MPYSKAEQNMRRWERILANHIVTETELSYQLGKVRTLRDNAAEKYNEWKQAVTEEQRERLEGNHERPDKGTGINNCI